MRSNAITNVLIGILTTIILAFGNGIKKDVETLKISMTEISTSYKIELPQLRKDIEGNKKSISVHQSYFDHQPLNARKEDDY